MHIGGLTKFSLSDFPGCAAAIIYTVGCDFRCSYCHNQGLWDEDYPKIDLEEVFAFLESRKGKLDGVVITGGEPTLHTDLIDFIRYIKNLGYQVKLNTNGNNPNCLKILLKENLLDYVAMDIKAPFALYEKVCAVKVNLETIKTSIDLIVESRVPHQFRTTWPKTLLNQNDIDSIKKLLPVTSEYVIQDCIVSS